MQNLLPIPIWKIDHNDKEFLPTQDQVIKAQLNPASPWIILPKNLFALVKNKWMQSFHALVPQCFETYCLVASPCNKVPYLDDFGVKLGSLNDTLPSNETVDQDFTENILFRGAREVERYNSQPMFFKIPFESYLIDGERIGLEKNLCYLTIRGLIPDNEKKAVLGLPFIQNYLTVLN